MSELFRPFPQQLDNDLKALAADPIVQLERNKLELEQKQLLHQIHHLVRPFLTEAIHHRIQFAERTMEHPTQNGGIITELKGDELKTLQLTITTHQPEVSYRFYLRRPKDKYSFNYELVSFEKPGEKPCEPRQKANPQDPWNIQALSEVRNFLIGRVTADSVYPMYLDFKHLSSTEYEN